MSREVDQRIVEMQLDNSDFERNAKQSIDTLDKLKDSSDMSSSAESFSKLSESASKIDFSGLSSGIETVKVKFDALSAIAFSTIQNFTNGIISAGSALVKNMTTDQISAGWGKYSEKMQAVQTIMSATAKDFDDARVQLDYINSELERLIWFTDETSYNMNSMVNNIGKFTSQGEDLHNSVTIMEGIADYIGLAGGNADKASNAMDIFAKSVGRGFVDRRSFDSLVNMTVITKDFREMVLETAAAHETLQKNADGTYSYLEKTSKGIKEHIVEIGNMNETLHFGWFNKDVIKDIFTKYGAFTDKLHEFVELTSLETNEVIQALDDYAAGTLDLAKISEETGISVEELDSQLKVLTSDEMELGRRALKASQEAKTFEDAINYVKDAVSSSWSTTNEIVFGDYLEAKELWTGLTDVLYDVFVAQNEARNEMLKEWKDNGGRTALLNSISNIWNGIWSIITKVKESFRSFFPPIQGKTLADITKNFEKFTTYLVPSEKTLDRIGKVCNVIFGLLRFIYDVAKQAIKWILSGLKQIWYILKNLFDYISPSFDDLRVKIKEVWEKVQNFIGSLRIGSNESSNFGKNLKDVSEKISKYFGKAIDKITSWCGNIGSIFTVVKDWIVNAAKTAWSWITKLFDNTSKGTGKLGEGFQSFKEKFLKIWNELKKHITFENIAKLIALLGSAEFVRILHFFGNLENSISKAFSSISSAIGNFGSLFKSLGGVFDTFSNKVSKTVKHKLLISNLKAIGIAIALITASFWLLSTIPKEKAETALLLMSSLYAMFFAMAKSFSKVGKESRDITSAITGSRNLVKTAGALILMSLAVLILVSAIKKLSHVDSTKLWDSVFVIISLLGVLTGIAKILGKSDKDIKNFAGAAASLLIMAIALNFLVAPLILISLLNPKKAWNAFLIIALLLAELAAIAYFLGDKAKQFAKAAASILLMTVAINLLVAPIMLLSLLDPKAALISAGIIVGLLVVLSGIAILLSKYAEKLGTSVGAFLLFSSGIAILAISLAILAKQDLAGIIVAVIAISAVMWELLALSKKIENVDAKVYGGFVVLSAAVLILAVSLAILAHQKWEGILAGGIALVAVMYIFMRLAGQAKQDISGAVGLLIMAGAIVMLAISLKILADIPFGQLQSAVLALLEVMAIMVLVGLAGTIAGPGLMMIGAGLLFIGLAFLSAGAGILMLANAIEKLDAVGPEGVKTLILAIHNLVGEFPYIAEKIGESLVAILKTLATKMPEIQAYVFTIAFGILTTLGILIPQVAGMVVDLLINILQILVEKFPEMRQTIHNFMIEFFMMLNTFVDDVVQEVIALVIMLLDTLGANVEPMADAGIEFLLNYLNGIADSLESHAMDIRNTMRNLVTSLLNTIITILTGKEGKGEEYVSMCESIMAGIGKGLSGAWEKTKEVAKKIWAWIKKAFFGIFGVKSESEELGEALDQNIAEGIEEGSDKVIKAVDKTIDRSVLTAKKGYGVKSPSTVFEGIGQNLMKGLNLGMLEEAPTVYASALDISKGTTDSFNSGLSDFGFGSHLDGLSDEDLTIRPIMDLSNIDSGVEYMRNALGSVKNGYSIGGSYSNVSATYSDVTGSPFTSGFGDIDYLSNPDRYDYDSGGGNGTTFNNTFNISGANDPKQVANEVSKIMQGQMERRNAVWG